MAKILAFSLCAAVFYSLRLLASGAQGVIRLERGKSWSWSPEAQQPHQLGNSILGVAQLQQHPMPTSLRAETSAQNQGLLLPPQPSRPSQGMSTEEQLQEG